MWASFLLHFRPGGRTCGIAVESGWRSGHYLPAGAGALTDSLWTTQITLEVVEPSPCPSSWNKKPVSHSLLHTKHSLFFLSLQPPSKHHYFKCYNFLCYLFVCLFVYWKMLSGGMCNAFKTSQEILLFWIHLSLLCVAKGGVSRSRNLKQLIQVTWNENTFEPDFHTL